MVLLASRRFVMSNIQLIGEALNFIFSCFAALYQYRCIVKGIMRGDMSTSAPILNSTYCKSIYVISHTLIPILCINIW